MYDGLHREKKIIEFKIFIHIIDQKSAVEEQTEKSLECGEKNSIASSQHQFHLRKKRNSISPIYDNNYENCHTTVLVKDKMKS